jgi:hypothetical protein
MFVIVVFCLCRDRYKHATNIKKKIIFNLNTQKFSTDFSTDIVALSTDNHEFSTGVFISMDTCALLVKDSLIE